MQVLKMTRRKYMNKAFLLNICHDSSDNTVLEPIRRSRWLNQQLPLDLFCRLCRKMIGYHLQFNCQLSIIISKKIDRKTILDHLRKRRELIGYFRRSLMSLD